jgi:hypothetical protein
MEQVEPVPAMDVVRSDTEQVCSSPVEIRRRPVRRGSPDDMRNGVEDRVTPFSAEAKSG